MKCKPFSKRFLIYEELNINNCSTEEFYRKIIYKIKCSLKYFYIYKNSLQSYCEAECFYVSNTKVKDDEDETKVKEMYF